MNKSKLTELRRSAEYELAPYDEKCPECDFPKSYRHKYGCEFPYFKKDPAAILELLNTLERAVEIVSFYADVNSWIKYHPRPGFNNESDSACVLKDHSDKEFIMGEDKSGYTGKFYKESFNVGGKRAREFLASMEGKKE